MLRDQAMTYRRHLVHGALAACATVLLVAASSVAAAGPAAAAGHGLKKVHDPGRVTGTIHGHCSYRDHGQLPDPRCTPGQHRPGRHPGRHPLDHLQEGLDRHGPAARVPDRAVQVRRGLSRPTAPRGQSGPSSTTWSRWNSAAATTPPTCGPSTRPTPNPKDKVEDALNAAVCEGRVSLTAAQDAIAADWLTAEKKLGLGGGGAAAGGPGAPPALPTTPRTATTTSTCTPTSRTGRSPPPPATGHRIATGPTPAAMPTCTWTPQAATRSR